MRILAILASCVLFIQCGDDRDIREENRIEILDYIADNNLDAEETASGLFYVIDVVGNGDHPTILDEVSVIYTGYFTNNQVFDSSGGNVVSFGLNQVIEGWQEGIPLFSKGGSGTLLIPSHLGYGSNPPSGIPANAVLLFDVELTDF